MGDFCDPGSRTMTMVPRFAPCSWQRFTEISRLQCPWQTHDCRTGLRGNRWRVLWCCRIKSLNPVPAISVAGAEFIVCDTKLTADIYLWYLCFALIHLLTLPLPGVFQLSKSNCKATAQWKEIKVGNEWIISFCCYSKSPFSVSFLLLFVSLPHELTSPYSSFQICI